MSAARSVTQEQLARVLEPEPIDVEELRAWLGMTQEEFAASVGRSARSVARWKAQTEAPTRSSAELAKSIRKLARIRFLLDDLVGHERAAAWLASPNRGFRGQAPIDLMTSGRADEVIEILEAVADGGTY